MKVLVLEDEKDLRKLIKDLIVERFGAEVNTVENGLDAFILCQKNQYDLIITDHQVPFMTGAAFIIGIRTRENMSQNTPVIMLSAFIDPEMKQKLQVPKIEFMEKPYDAEHLIKVITPYLM